MGSVKELQLECFLKYVVLISLLSPAAALAGSGTLNVSLPGCPDQCGKTTIPYPFGTSPGCYRDGFALTCNESTNPPKVFLYSPASNIELIDINIDNGEIRVYKRIAYRCYNNVNQLIEDKKYNPAINLRSRTYHFSHGRNKFTAIGCNNLAYIVGKGKGFYQSGCLSFCESLNSTAGDGGSCNGLGCCQTAIPAGLSSYKVNWGYDENMAWDFNPCMYAVLAEENWYKFNVEDLRGETFLKRNQKRVHLILDWAIRDNGTCVDSETEKRAHTACLSNNSRCHNTSNGEGYLCKCLPGYSGNPYIPDGCRDIDECNSPDEHPCHDKCINTEGGYQCFCPKWTRGDGKAGNCHDIFPYPARVTIYIFVGVVVLMGTCFLAIAHQQRKRHIKEKEEYQKYYQMMDNHHRVFSKKQIEVATNNFGETHVLGAGGQGKVYKGSLENNQIVAIKKSKEVEETKRGEFVNEIILLSQINHKNIVKLLGCCLEVRIPMLVYEYVPNGTLFELIHGKGNTTPISLGTRLSVALESAEALDYLHSSISQTIIHGDVKSANILLDDQYRAKVADFGASKLVPNDDTQVVNVVQGTRGYLDPEYVATAVLTKKSDVYSFGVVILELITRKLAIFSDEMDERKHLATCFVSKASKNEHHDFLDKDIITTDDAVIIEVLQEVSELAVWCLNVGGEDRPTMTQVVEKLQNIVRLHSSLVVPKSIHEHADAESIVIEPTSYTMSYAFHSSDYGSVLEIETSVPQ